MCPYTHLYIHSFILRYIPIAIIATGLLTSHKHLDIKKKAIALACNDDVVEFLQKKCLPPWIHESACERVSWLNQVLQKLWPHFGVALGTDAYTCSIHTYASMHAHVYMHICIYVYVYICIYVCMFIYDLFINTHTYKNLYVFRNTDPCMHSYILIHIYPPNLIHTNTY